MNTNPPKSPLLPAEEEIDMVKEVLILTVMLDLIEFEVRRLKTAGLKMLIIHTRKLRAIQDMLPKELHRMHRELKMRGVRIIETNRARGHIKGHYLCRGYEYEMLLQGDTIRAEIQIKLAAHYGIDLTADDKYGDEIP
ncbi:hypothetical protein [Paenibacillus methanolicus]|uniref:Uncharacterized protein n=1 Tax=Paenibacillus methanolicus TaxID=582686 RepID=A0A5S5CDP9_9BACL|nr:hypothetical protein [Paenibacillus methanolicus]TYP77511.1 hypothetical protein BCM02_10271 [Paenibacillus methanolicus]